MNRPARFTVADLRRALRAAELAGPQFAVEIAPDGTIRILRHDGLAKPRPWPQPLEPEEVVVF